MAALHGIMCHSVVREWCILHIASGSLRMPRAGQSEPRIACGSLRMLPVRRCADAAGDVERPADV